MKDFMKQKLRSALWNFFNSVLNWGGEGGRKKSPCIRLTTMMHIRMMRNLIHADHLEKGEVLGQVITILVPIMLKRKDRLPGRALGVRRCQDATCGGFMPQGSSQSQFVSIIIIDTSIITIITNIFVFIITIILSFRL